MANSPKLKRQTYRHRQIASRRTKHTITGRGVKYAMRVGKLHAARKLRQRDRFIKQTTAIKLSIPGRSGSQELALPIQVSLASDQLQNMYDMLDDVPDGIAYHLAIALDNIDYLLNLPSQISAQAPTIYKQIKRDLDKFISLTRSILNRNEIIKWAAQAEDIIKNSQDMVDEIEG